MVLTLLIALAVLVAVPSPALAVTDARTLPIVALAGEAGEQPLGDARLATEFAGGQVTVAVSAPAVRLQLGARLRLLSCVQTHVLGAAPQATCVERAVDTRQWSGAANAAAPAADLQVGVPAAPLQGWATGMIEVLRLDADGTWRRVASSWEPGALAGAGLPLDAGRPFDPPGPQGAVLPGTPDGGANTGARDSLCVPQPSVAAGSPPAGVTARALGADAPAYSESGAPDGELRGVVLLLHGGGWAATGSGSVAGMRPDAERWRARGWLTVNATYRPCGESAADAVWFVDRIRARYGAQLPLCVVGTSAGGHLALLAAARRPATVDCVVNQSGPTDLQALAGDTAADPHTGGRWTDGPVWGHNLAGGHLRRREPGCAESRDAPDRGTRARGGGRAGLARLTDPGDGVRRRPARAGPRGARGVRRAGHGRLPLGPAPRPRPPGRCSRRPRRLRVRGWAARCAHRPAARCARSAGAPACASRSDPRAPQSPPCSSASAAGPWPGRDAACRRVAPRRSCCVWTVAHERRCVVRDRERCA